ncbi:40S ribosomal protein S21 [Galendromus occidentalis]|uniref:40S ribosomal protein S21 n=1 Tax=Galendromus occidentalis TaxID=34638 RepID=A0AAJ6QM84_9ACAR|nr:40S ribosomal protein S21 [Galendromus occidentalis]XP_003737448.1 40S ribosomal protein S21 [Galendromus occidentalis]XP_003737449.1 40S ribosomal protein S21 [Galendromus occidentalis]
MQNDSGECVDMYIPRKCSTSNRIIHAKDHASIQLDLAVLNDKGIAVIEDTKRLVICGAIRRMGESDDCVNRLAKDFGMLPQNL